MTQNYGVNLSGAGANPSAATEASKGMSDEQFKTLVGNEIRDALTYVDSEISPERTRNYQYFLGEMPDVPPVEGRSSVVIRVVADYIGFILPSLLRTMISGRKIIEYPAKGVQDEQAAKMMTDYVNDVVLRSDNQIEREAYGWGFDALVNKVGVLKVWWEEKKDIKDFILRDLNEMQFVQAVMQVEQQGFEIVAYEKGPDEPGPDVQHPVTGEVMPGPPIPGKHTLVARQTIDNSFVKFEVLPPEEFVISRDARSLESARLKSHRTYKYVGDLIDEGYNAETVLSLPSWNTHDANNEALVRQPTLNNFSSISNDPMLRKVAVHQGTVLCDKDGTGLKEWYFVAGGWSTSIEILEVKPFEDECYFCDFCPIPLPHIFFGRCPADDLIEIQRIQTVLARQTNDNIYLTNSPQQEVLVNNIIGQRIEYVQNKSPGGIIPVTALGTVNNVTVPFMAGSSLELMQYWDMQAENRTGASRNTMGLDPNVLQNQSATAAMLQDSASKLKLETIARIWASGGMRKLGRAIMRITKRYQDFSRIVKMNGVATQVDPRMWAELEDWDVMVNTGLGTGDRSRDVQSLGLVIGKMEAIFQQYGPNNPVVTAPMLSHAYGRFAEALGLNNTDQFFKPLPMDWQPPPAPPEIPVPVQVQKEKNQGTLAAKQMDVQAGAHKTTVDNLTSYLLGIREQDIEAALEARKIAMKQQADANIAKVKGQMH